MISDISSTTNSLLSGLTASGNTTATNSATDSSTSQSDTVSLSDAASVMQTLLAQAPSLKPQLQLFNNDYNVKLCQNQAQNIVSEAKNEGVSLDYNTVYKQVKLQNGGIMDNNDNQNFLARAKADGFQAGIMTLPLTQNEQAVLQSAYEHGVPSNTIDDVIAQLGTANLNAENNNLPLPAFNAAYLGTLLKTAQAEGDSSAAYGLQNFINNFDAISAAANSSATATA